MSEYIFQNAVQLMRKGDNEEALDAFAQAIKSNPKHAWAWAFRGRIENDAGRAFNGLIHMDMAVKCDPGRHELWSDRGIMAAAAGYYEEAKRSFLKSLALEPSLEAHYNLGNTLCSMMQIDEAEKHYRAALVFEPDSARIRTNLSHVLMARGEWPEAWQQHRYRFGSPGFPLRPQYDFPLWRGEDLTGKTIMLYAEQGFGDEILGMRFARAEIFKGATVILAVRPLMYRLARSAGLADHVIMQHDKPPVRPDYAAALLDVPAFYADWFSGGRPYLRAPKRDVFLQWPPGIRVGICWASGKRPLQPSTDAMAKQKTLPFSSLAPLAREGVVLVSLQHQHNDHAALRRAKVIDPMPTVQDFEDTAWIIDQLDLVISVDTGVAHLAAAMGKPVWNLVRFDALWPWGVNKAETAWYNSMRLYRQDMPLDWSTALRRVMADFNGFVAAKEPAAA